MKIDADGQIRACSEPAAALITAASSLGADKGILTFAGPMRETMRAALRTESPVPVRIEISDRALGTIACLVFAPKDEAQTRLIHFWAANLAPEPSYRQILSKRELQIFHLIAEGQRRDQIAHQLDISLATVDLHSNGLRKKLGARTLPEAVARGYELGLR
ncbi:LuxR C-terminal-related transcriptional regulator [Thioclava sp. GXIMD2076]|uniref:LuxR C-terminal-related transcriptional regulator n=1 Tax=Thioclava kandeliae TaxID=3070818 RepID=A0ABV1SB81_9RHOB